MLVCCVALLVIREQEREGHNAQSEVAAASSGFPAGATAKRPPLASGGITNGRHFCLQGVGLDSYHFGMLFPNPMVVGGCGSPAARVRNNGPLSSPRPFSRTRVSPTVLSLEQPFILPRSEADDNVRLARSQGEDVEPRVGTKRAYRLGEGRRGVPLHLRRCLSASTPARGVIIPQYGIRTSPVSFL